MNRRELSLELAQRLKISHRQAAFLVENFFDLLKEFLARGEKVSFQGFGTFGIKELPPREFFHLPKKEKATLKARRRPFFRPSPKLLAKLNGKRPLQNIFS